MPPKSGKGQSKVAVDKLAWKWAETTEPAGINDEHLKLAYRLNLKRCSHTGQRRNCKGNPQCLIGLGEKEWLGEIADENWHDIEDPDNEKRKKNMFVGLKNLGATCYVNSLLQVWFHNPVFCAAIYQYAEESSLDAKPESPKTICGHLQLIFALLEKSSRRYIDPTPFIQSLGIDTMQQQDAQEFSKLFISLLEETLSLQRNPSVRNVVQELFSGEYAYVTRCTKCGNISKRPSKFYELDLNIKGHKDLHQCLGEFLKEEKLEGDNQYMCHVCQSKQNAGRKIALTHLPRVLNLQLLRFVFDRNTGHKKKLNTCIQFPEEIDMSQYLGGDIDDPERYKYELKAVLIHRGVTAYSGHYIAHIRDNKNGSWYKFNDEEVEKMSGSNLQLGNEEEIELNQENASKPNKKPRLMKGTHASKNAYMLVYHKKMNGLDRPPDAIGSDIPVSVQEYVAKDNISFHDWCLEMVAMRDKNVATGKAKQEEIKNMYQMIQLTENCEYEWLTAEWLSKWLTDVENTPKIDNSKLLCSHRMLNPDNVTKAKCVNKTGANLLYTKYDGGPRLTQDMLCLDCIRERCRGIRLKTKTTEDSQFISTALKNFTPEGTCYWVGKESLRSWKKMALEQLNSTEPQSNGHTQENSENDSPSTNLEIIPGSFDTKDNQPKSTLNSKHSVTSDDGLKSHSLVFSSQVCGADSTKSGVKGPNVVNKVEADVLDAVRSVGVTSLENDGTLSDKVGKGSDSKVINSNKCDRIVKETDSSILRDSVVPSSVKCTQVTEGTKGSNADAQGTDSSSVQCATSLKSGHDIAKKVEMNKGDSSRVDARQQVLKVHDTETNVQMTTGLKCGDIGEKVKNTKKPASPSIDAGQQASSSDVPTTSGLKSDETVEQGKDLNKSDSPGVDDKLQGNGEKEPQEDSFAFNEDLLCEPHGKLCTEVADRRLVSEEVWKRLKSYFPDAPEFLETSDSCEECTAIALEAARVKEYNKTSAAEQKQTLSDLYHGKARPKLYTSQEELYVVNNIFLESWRKFLKNPSRGERTTALGNCILLCDHDKLTFQPETLSISDPSENAVTLLTPTEWNVLQCYITVDKTITVLPIKQDDNSTILVTSPEVCDDCIAIRLSLENFERMDYKNAKIYVQKLSPGSDFPPPGTKEGSNSGNSSEMEDPEFSESGKKKRKFPSGEDATNSMPEEIKPAKVKKGNDGQIRRSTRHHKVRGEKMVTVDSDQTLRDLKLQLMKMFSVAPFDQHLMLNGKKLTDQSATLASLGVSPESVLQLKVDEPMDGAYLIEEIPTSGPEEGFKGTGLLAGR